MRALVACMLCACFGSGPEPTVAPEASVLFALDLGEITSDNCQPTHFIGNVALGESVGYAITHTYLPACSGGGGSGEQGIPAFVYEFPLAGGATRLLDDSAGNVSFGGGGKPRVAAFGSEAVWAVTPTTGMTEIELRSRSETISSRFPSMVRGAGSMVVDATHTYLAGIETGRGSSNVNDPRYPCCGDGGPGGGESYLFVQVPNTVGGTPTGMAGTAPKFFCEQMKDCLVANSSSLFYLERSPAMPNDVAISRRAKDTVDLGTPVAMVAGTPVGLAVTDTHVAWSTSVVFSNTNPPPRCSIFAAQPATEPGGETQLFHTDAFSCLDVAIDETHAYFAIVELVSFEDQSDGILANRGIARVPLAGGAIETLALGITGPRAGPRQLFVDGDDLIVVAPFVVASIRKSALDGRLDIAP